MWKNIPLTARAAQRVKFLWVDDAWVTGFLAQHLQIKHHVTYDYFFFKTYRVTTKERSNVGLNYDLMLRPGEFFSLLGAHQMCSI